MKPALRYPLLVGVVSLGLTVAAVYFTGTGHAAQEHGRPGRAASAVALFAASAVVAAAVLPIVRRLAPRVFPS